MSHLDGVSYGYDEIGIPDIPLTYDMMEWENRRPILAARNQYPYPNKKNYPQVELSDQNLTRTVANPPDFTLLGRKVDKFTVSPNLNITEKDLTIVLIFVFILVLVMQIKMYYMIQLIAAQTGKTVISV